jgi:hypothetical protein
MKTPEEIRKLAHKKYSVQGSGGGQYTEGLQEGRIVGFIDGYDKCQKDNEEKVFRLVSEITTLNEEIDSLKINNKYTLDDMKKAFFNGGIDLSSDKSDDIQFNEFIQSIKKQG